MRRLPIILACMLFLMTALGAVPMGVLADEPAATMEDAGEDIGEAAGDIPEEGRDEDAPAATPSPSPRPTAAPVVNDDFVITPAVGYGGLINMGRWTPAFVTVVNNGRDFDGYLGVNVFSNLTTYDRYEIPMTIAAGATKQVLLPFKPMTRQDMYAFELTRDGEIVAEQRVSPARMTAPETLTIGVLSDTPEALAYLNQRANGLDTLRGEVWTTIPLSADTFPQTSELMAAFSMLVVDGIDVRTLTADQQEALRGWLQGGGLVLVSGGAKAATGYPFFSSWTKQSAGTLTEAEDITPDLLAYATIKGQPYGEAMWLSALTNQGQVIGSAAGETLVTRHSAGEGVIFTMAFDLGGKAMAGWAPATSIIPRMLRQSISTMYQRMLNSAEQLRYGYNDVYQAQDIINNLAVRNDESGVPVILLLVAYVIIVGFGGYLLLKRIDRREWLWAAAPASAILFAVIMLLLSRGTTMNTPVALTASRVIFDGEDAQMNTYIGVATPHSGELIIQTDQKQLPEVISENSYWYDDTTNVDRLFRPVNLRQRYRMGSQPAVGFASSNAWEARMLKLSLAQTGVGSVSGRVWMEADGMHGEVKNDTDYALHGSLVATAFGYAMIGDILPGQTATFAMLYPSAPVDQTDPNFKPKAGVMYSTLDMTFTAQGGYYYDSSLYNYLNRAIYNDDDHTNATARQQMALVQMFEQDWQFYGSSGAFYFFGFNDSIGQIAVSLGGEPVSRTAHTAVVGSQMAFEPIGPTGQVMFPQGVIVGEVIVDQGEDKKARPATEDDPADTNNPYGTSNTYISMAAPVALRFMLPSWGEYAIEKMTLTGISYESLPTLYLYNNDTKAWDEQLLLSVSMEGEKWASYIDEEGGIYVRYTPAEGANRYESMNMPTIALKGEVTE